MSDIKITNISGNNNIIGDNNVVQNNISASQYDKVLTRDEYFQMILEIRELERISVAAYLEDKFQKFNSKNPDFVKILYKDISKVIEGVDKEGDNDLAIVDGDFAIEYGDIKLTGHQNNLHPALTWLWLELVKEFSKENPLDVTNKLDRFEKDFLPHNYDTAEYAKKISKLNFDLKQERDIKDR